jgi:hypothetical protein
MVSAEMLEHHVVRLLILNYIPQKTLDSETREKLIIN